VKVSAPYCTKIMTPELLRLLQIRYQNTQLQILYSTYTYTLYRYFNTIVIVTYHSSLTFAFKETKRMQKFMKKKMFYANIEIKGE